MPTIACVVGTRPEAVKMAPVVLTLKRHPEMTVRLVATSQHRELLRQALDEFGLVPDRDLDLMRADQGLADLTARAVVALTDAFGAERPDYVLAQGDTTTVLCAGLASYYARAPFGHVEAGLRTGNRYAPFPEEMNRVLVSQLADLHFAPTASAQLNLRREGISEASIHLTGNTVVDALQLMLGHGRQPSVRLQTDRFVLVTTHRRENFGAPLREVCAGVRALVERFPDLSVVIPVHPNPQVRATLDALLAGLPRVHLIDPVPYRDFVALLSAAHVIVTDSGGVQEEAPSLGKPVLVLRDTTERPEAVAAGKARLIGTTRNALVEAVAELWTSDEAYARFRAAPNPYGDGHAAIRIVQALGARLGTGPLLLERPLPEWSPSKSVNAGG